MVPAASNQGRFQYTGQTWLPELGLYYYKARVYSPSLGRFLQTDPIGYDDGVNLYAYVGNDPLNATDPTGQFAFLLPAIPAALEASVYVTTAIVAVIGAVAVYNDRQSKGASPPSSPSDDNSKSTPADKPAEGKGANPPNSNGNRGNRFPDRELPRDPNGNAVPGPEAEGPHTQLGQKDGSEGKCDQASDSTRTENQYAI